MTDVRRDADQIWDRACGQGGHGRGDVALASLIALHSLAMNGGVLHSLETLGPMRVAAAIDGYRYFGLDAIVPMLEEGRRGLQAGSELEALEDRLDEQYGELVPSDDLLFRAFLARLQQHSSDFE